MASRRGWQVRRCAVASGACSEKVAAVFRCQQTINTCRPLHRARTRTAAGYFLCAAKESNQRNAAPLHWFLASPRTSLPPDKKRGASQLDLARDTHHPALRDSDKGSPRAPWFLACG